MINGYVAVIDSGIGGLTVLNRLVKEFPNEKFIYQADNDNAPYGNYSTFMIRRLTLKLLTSLFCYEIKSVVIACNTISLSASDLIRGLYDVFLVFPPAEIFEAKKEQAYLMATVSTCKKYRGYKYVKTIPMRSLAGDIERNVFTPEKIDVKKYVKNLSGKIHTLILGCTHYEFVENEILVHLKPQKTLNGTDLCVYQMKKSNIFNKTIKIISINQPIFIGANSEYNLEVWKKVVANIKKSK